MRIPTKRWLALATVSAGFALTLTACGDSGTATSGGTQYRFENTGTFSSATPEAESIDGPKLGTLGDAPKPGSEVKVGILVKSLTNQYWQQVEAGLLKAKEDFKVQTSDIKSSQSETDTSQQLQICQSMLLENYSAIIVSPQTTSNLNPCLTQFKAKNIPIINIAAPGDGLTSTVYVGSALLNDGKEAGDYLAKALPAGSQVAQIEGLPGSSAADLRSTGFKNSVGSSKLDLVTSVAGNWDEQTAYQQAQNLLSKYPNLKGIYAANDTMGVAVAKATKQANRKDVAVVGTDGVPIAMDSIGKGEMTATITPFPYYQGYWALESALRVLDGQKVPLWVNTPDQTITKDNINQFFDDKGTAKPGLFGKQ
jgi:ribose transport system substrate-binding protein